MIIALMGAASMGAVYAEALPGADGIQAVQQAGTCTGVVKDAAGETIIGASVVVKGTTNGTVSDLDGNFILTVSNPQAVIVIRYIGYKEVEMTVKVGQKVITSKYSGTEVKCDGEEYTIVRQSDILAIVED